MIALTSMVYLFVLLPLGMIWSGYALSKLWSWFLVPSLGVPALSIPAAIGLAMVVSFVTYEPYEPTKGEGTVDEIIVGAIQIAMKPAIALVFGWVIAQWM